jgi:hypothetical protein
VHVFCDAGNLLRYADEPDAPLPELRALGENTRLSVGAGLVLRVGQLQVEANLCKPLSYTTCDRFVRWQLGFSVR